MKKVMSIVAVVALAVSVANAELLKNFKHDGKLTVNAYTTSNINDFNADKSDKTSDVDTQLLLNLGFDLNESANAVVSIIKNDRQHGDGSQDMHTAQTMLNFEQAYVNLLGVFGIDHKIGRQYYGNEGDLVLYYGPRGFPYTYIVFGGNGFSVSGVDGWTGWYKTGKWDMHAVAFKTTNTNSPATEDSDVDVVGINAKYALREDLNLGAYMYEGKDYNAAAQDLTLDVLGMKVDGKFMGFGYYAELAKNYGRQAPGVNYTGTAMLAKADYSMDIAGKITFMGEYLRTSGDKDNVKKNKAFNPIATDYRPGVYWGGMMTSLSDPTGAGDTGLTAVTLGAKWNPAKIEKLNLSVKYYDFAPTEEKVNLNPVNFNKIGTEMDLVANWKHSENVELIGYLAQFNPNKDYIWNIYSLADHDPVRMMGIAATVKF